MLAASIIWLKKKTVLEIYLYLTEEMAQRKKKWELFFSINCPLNKSSAPNVFKHVRGFSLLFRVVEYILPTWPDFQIAFRSFCIFRSSTYCTLRPPFFRLSSGNLVRRSNCFVFLFVLPVRFFLFVKPWCFWSNLFGYGSSNSWKY